MYFTVWVLNMHKESSLIWYDEISEKLYFGFFIIVVLFVNLYTIFIYFRNHDKGSNMRLIMIPYNDGHCFNQNWSLTSIYPGTNNRYPVNVRPLQLGNFLTYRDNRPSCMARIVALYEVDLMCDIYVYPLIIKKLMICKGFDNHCSFESSVKYETY